VSDFGTTAVIAGEVGRGHRSDGPERQLMTRSGRGHSIWPLPVDRPCVYRTVGGGERGGGGNCTGYLFRRLLGTIRPGGSEHETLARSR
jgi:hypothetical protein